MSGTVCLRCLSRRKWHDPSITSEESFHRGGRFLIGTLKQVAVSIHRQLDRRMPEALRSALGMHAFVDQQRRVGVAQVVEAQAREADAFADLLKPAQHVAFFKRRPDL